jgi:hypothetical protein
MIGYRKLLIALVSIAIITTIAFYSNSFEIAIPSIAGIASAFFATNGWEHSSENKNKPGESQVE